MLSYHEKIHDNVFMIKPHIRRITYFLITWSLLKYIWYDSWIIILSGDIEILVQNILSQAKFISVHKLGIICLSETYLNSETSPDDDNLEIAGYNIIRKDHTSNTKRGRVCVYYKNTLPFQNN